MADSPLQKLKNAYFALEDKWYSFLEGLDERLPFRVTSLTDPIDKVVPSFAVVVTLAFVLIAAGAFLLLGGLPHNSQVTLTFLDDEGNIVEGAQVNLTYLDETRPFTSNEFGRVELSVPLETEIQIQALKEGHDPADQTLTAVSPEISFSIVMAKSGIGLALATEERTLSEQSDLTDRRTLAKAFSPIMGIILLLIVTRIPELGIRDLLNGERPALDVTFGSLGEFSVSAALVLKLSNIFLTECTWAYNALFVPALIPFFLICALSIPVFGLKGAVVRRIWSESYDRMKIPIITLAGALVMVELMMVGGDRAKTMIIGKAFAEISGEAWQYVASYLGALGSFFSGSATVSNLTFSGIQDSIAQSVGLDRELVLSLQSVGASMGNMVCINNIIAVCSILGVYNQEGFILKRTVIPMVLYGIIAGVIGLVL